MKRWNFKPQVQDLSSSERKRPILDRGYIIFHIKLKKHNIMFAEFEGEYVFFFISSYNLYFDK